MNNIQSDKNWFIENLKNKDLLEKIKNIKIIITDIDGCLTNGNIFIAESRYPKDNDYSKHIAKSFCVQDGYIISECIKNNLLDIAFLTGRTDEATKIRAKMLNIPENLCFTGISQNKIEKVKIIQKQNNIKKDQTLYFGDDFLDYEAIDAVGIMCSPQNSPFYFQEKANLVIPRDGGNGALRLLLDFVLYIQGKHFAQQFIETSIK